MLQQNMVAEVNSPGQMPQSSQTPPDLAGQRWTEPETLHLIDAYQEKWYALKRGHLKARHWEEVAYTVFLCCGGTEATKSSVQCRHKIEKLRRKYRGEKQVEEQSGPGASRWVYFQRLDNMELGPGNGMDIVKVGNAPAGMDSGKTSYLDLEMHEAVRRDMQDRESTVSLNDDIEDADHPPRFDELLDKSTYAYATNSENDTSYTSLNKKHEVEHDKEDSGRRTEGCKMPRVSTKSNIKRRKIVNGTPISELTSVVRVLGEGFLRIEQLKLEMQRDNERLRAEMELKRTGMLLESQKQIAELFSRALTRKKVVKRSKTRDA